MSFWFTIIGTALAIALLWSSTAVAQPGAEVPHYPWDQRPGKCFVPGAENIGFCSEQQNWADFAETVHRVQRLFADPNVVLLNRAAVELALDDKQFVTGQYHFEAWYLANRSQMDSPSEDVREFVEDWRKGESESSPALIVQALALMGEAWRARGGGLANTVSLEAWEIFYQKLAQADVLLDAASSEIKRSGPWHLLKVQLAFDQQISWPKRLEVLQAAVAAWPDSTMLYEIPMSRASPVWGGSFALMDGIAKLAAGNSKTRSYAAMYALVYEHAFRGNQRYTLRSSQIDWGLAKQGFRDIERSGQHPKWIWKNFASLACQMRDQDEARMLYELHDKQEGDTPSQQEPDPCRAFANEGKITGT